MIERARSIVFYIDLKNNHLPVYFITELFYLLNIDYEPDDDEDYNFIGVEIPVNQNGYYIYSPERFVATHKLMKPENFISIILKALNSYSDIDQIYNRIDIAGNKCLTILNKDIVYLNGTWRELLRDETDEVSDQFLLRSDYSNPNFIKRNSTLASIFIQKLMETYSWVY